MTQEELFESYYVESSTDYEDDGKKCGYYCTDCLDCPKECDECKKDCWHCRRECDWECDYGCGCDDY